MISIILCFWTERSEDTVLEIICIAACVVSLMHAIRVIRFEFNCSGRQFWFLQWLSLANPVLPTEITICRFADECGGGGGGCSIALITYLTLDKGIKLKDLNGV